jgi:hypothetical protein
MRALANRTRHFRIVAWRGFTASSTAPVQVDGFQDIITSAVEKVLLDMLRLRLSSIL